MAVAQDPRNARERLHIGGTKLKQRLGLRHDVDQATVLQLKRVIGAQPNRCLEIKLDARAFHREDVTAVAATLGEVENERIGGGSVTMLAGQHFDRTRHK